MFECRVVHQLLPCNINHACLLYTSDAADDGYSVDLGGRRIIKKIFFKQKTAYEISEGLVGSEMCIRDSPSGGGGGQHVGAGLNLVGNNAVSGSP